MNQDNTPTTDLNDNDWNNMSEVNKMAYIKKNCTAIAFQYSFGTNDSNTWNEIISSIGIYLTVLWKKGWLKGANYESAFYVECGLGSTMTADDILNGILIADVGVVLSQPGVVSTFSIKQHQPLPNT